MLALVVVVVLGGLTNGQDQGCSSHSMQLPYYKCNVFYNFCSNQTQQGQNVTVEYDFIFRHCAYSYCVDDSNRGCLKYQQSDLSQSDCIQKCCNSSSYSKFTNQTFNKCTGDNESLMKKKDQINSLEIGLIVAGLILFVILLFLAIYYRQKIRKCFKCCSKTLKTLDPQNQNQHQQVTIQESQNDDLSFHSHNHILKNQSYLGNICSHSRYLNLIWTQIQSQNDILSEMCSICLCGNLNSQTSCGHKFHFECFKLWIERNPSCPNCTKKSFNDLKLYCLICRKKQTKLKVEANTKIYHPQINLICDQCYRLQVNKCKSCLQQGLK